MSLQDELKAKALALIHQQMANWVVEIQRQIARQQADFVSALDVLQENAAKYDERIDESAIDAAIAETLALQPPPAPVGPGIDRLKASIVAVEKGTSLSEVLIFLVNEVSQYADRAAMFIIKGNNAIGWYARGIDPPDLVKQINIPLGADTVFRIVLSSRQALSGHIAHSPGTMQAIARLGGAPQGILAVPLILRDKIAAILYCDSTQEEISVAETSAIEILVFFAAKVIDLISLAPKAAGAAKVAGAPAHAMRTHAEERPMTPSPGGFTPVPPASEESAATVMFRSPVAAALKQQMSGIAAHTPIPAATPPPPPAPVRPALTPDDQKAHEDAKRFARLVVSEIKLYNEAKVTEGRRNRDVYERLKEDIERGRQMYLDRVPAQIRESTNYFVDELVRILAGGDPSALGPM
ncbi:MAG: hypothetical protein JXO72_13085 [Vicinamibacteria bacterium]|nr:hypothetical protein [Vicinamibacteria bacterium]